METDKISKCVCIECGYVMKCLLGDICLYCPKCSGQMIVGSSVVEQLK